MDSAICLKVAKGIIVVIPAQHPAGDNNQVTESYLALGSDGLVLAYKDIHVSIPEEMFEYILENRLVSIYELRAGNYLQVPTATFELGRDTIIEGTTIYRYEKRKREESRDVAAGEAISGP